MAYELAIERLERILKEVRDNHDQNIRYRDGHLVEMDRLNHWITADEQAIADIEAALEMLRSGSSEYMPPTHPYPVNPPSDERGSR